MLLTEHAVTVAATLVCVAMHGVTVHADTYNPEQPPRGERLPRCWALLS